MSTPRELFETHHLALFRFLRRMAGSREAAEDLLQETFLRVVRAQSAYREEGQARAWLFRIARNLLLNKRRDEGRQPYSAALEEATASTPPPRLLERISLEEAMAGLDQGHREAFLLREVGGLGYQEIAALCGITADAVRNRIYRARTKLRRTLTVSQGGQVRWSRKENTS